MHPLVVEAGLQGNFELGHTRGIHRHTQRVYAGGYARHTHTRKNDNLVEIVFPQVLEAPHRLKHTLGIRRLVNK